MLENITEVYLLNVPIEKDYKHTLYFGNASSQLAFFQSKIVHSETEFSYQRKEGYIRYPKHYDDLQNCNYIMYRNTASSEKWYYAFITKMEYKNPETTWIYFETDVIQTWLFDYTVKPSFIEREHTNDDTIGKHTVPENLECGEYICKFNQKVSDFNELWVIVGVTGTRSGEPHYGSRYDGLFSGVAYVAFPLNEIDKITSFLLSYSERPDSITTMFIAPKAIFKTILPDDKTDTSEIVLGSETPTNITHTINRDVGKYEVKNNKLNCYPYRYLLVSNNNGASAIYQYEHFSEDMMKFNIAGALTPGCSIRLRPHNYKGVSLNNEEGLNLGKFPICNWTSDEYTNWLTQNGLNIGLNMAMGLGQIVAGVAMTAGTGGAGAVLGGGSIIGGVSTIASQLGQIHQMSFTPPQSHGNINSGDITTATYENTFTFYGMNIKEEYVRIIDEFFSMFGYKTNRVKTPLKNHRKNFWFTKTIDVNIDGAVPQNDLQTIKDAYNNGITFWKNPANIGDYSVSNEIV